MAGRERRFGVTKGPVGMRGHPPRIPTRPPLLKEDKVAETEILSVKEEHSLTLEIKASSWGDAMREVIKYADDSKTQGYTSFSLNKSSFEDDLFRARWH